MVNGSALLSLLTFNKKRNIIVKKGVNKGMNKLTLRGQTKVNAQWQLYCLVHNIEKPQNTMH
tara:strand:- start:91 stop:276 length:186 start_codon:yes stop_codon:yes gene_type:complete